MAKTSTFTGLIILPGTDVSSFIEETLKEVKTVVSDNSKGVSPTIKVGNGLLQMGEGVVAVKAGILHFARPNKFWIENRQQRYISAQNDLVVGIITSRLSEGYRVDLGCNLTANLNFSGFEGTTKKNRPNLNIGDVVYARVSMDHKDLEPEIVCLDQEGNPEGFGEVKEGLLVSCSCLQSRKLQAFNNPVLTILGKHFAFEIVVGANGRFVLSSAKPLDVINLVNIILDSESVPPGTDITRWTYDRINALARNG